MVTEQITEKDLQDIMDKLSWRATSSDTMAAVILLLKKK
jgi:hypothetical protein